MDNEWYFPGFVNMLLAAGGLVGVLVALAAGLQPLSLLVAVCAGCVMIVLGFVSDRRRQRQAEVKRLRRAEAQTEQYVSAGREVVVYGVRFGWLLAALLLCFGAGFLFLHAQATDTDGVVLLMGAFLWFVLALLVIRYLFRVGRRPLLRMDEAGFETPGRGRVAWPQVAGIDLQVPYSRGFKTYVLRLLLDDAGVYSIASVPLWHRSIEPEAVYGTARRYWTQATGYDYPWMPGIPAETVQALQRIDRRRGCMDRWRDDGLPPDPVEFGGEADAMRRDLDIVADEMRRHGRMSMRDVLLALVALLVFVAIAVWWISY